MALDRRRFLIATSLLAGSTALTFSFPVRADADTVRSFVQSLIDATIEILRLPIEPKSVRRDAFKKLLKTYFDVPYITRKVISRYWRQATPEQQERFSQEFYNHILNVYTDRLGSYSDERVTIRRVAARNNVEFIVFTEVERGADTPLSLDWLIREMDDGPRVVDVAAEGVSLMQTKRSEFTTVIARDGLDALIHELVDLNKRVGGQS